MHTTWVPMLRAYGAPLGKQACGKNVPHRYATFVPSSLSTIVCRTHSFEAPRYVPHASVDPMFQKTLIIVVEGHTFWVLLVYLLGVQVPLH